MAQQVIKARTEWTDVNGTPYSFRVWDGKLWRRELGAQFYGYSQILTIPTGARLAKEWLADNNLYI